MQHAVCMLANVCQCVMPMRRYRSECICHECHLHVMLNSVIRQCRSSFVSVVREDECHLHVMLNSVC